MKIGILTFYESLNYGTVLQAYALQKYLTDCGHDVELVRIRRNIHARSHHFRSQPVAYSLMEKVVVKIRSEMAEKAERTRKEQFLAFQNDYLKVSHAFYEDEKQLREHLPQYDLYLSGGDQIWNPYHKVFSTHYMWDFLPDGSPIASYASSFGVDSIDDGEILEVMRNCLRRYDSLCIREQSGVRMAENMGLQASQVLDPVFLLRSQWTSFVRPTHHRKKYCLVYALIDYPKTEDAQIREYARKYHLEIKIMPYSRRNCLGHYTREFSAGPIEFLDLIANAEFVFTNSFHGAAFSILFQKQFQLLDAVSPEGRKKRGRLNDLLEQCGISVRNEETLIDYTSVNKRLDVLLADSQKKLSDICAAAAKRALDGVEGNVTME